MKLVAEVQILALGGTVGSMCALGKPFVEVVRCSYLKSAKFSGVTDVGWRCARGTSARKRWTCKRDKASEAQFLVKETIAFITKENKIVN